MLSRKQQLILDEVDYETIGECIIEYFGIDPHFGTLPGHTDLVTSCCMSSDDRFIVSASCDNTLKIWDVESGTLLKTLQGHQGNVDSCCLSSDDRFIVSESWDNTLKIWDVESGALLKTLQGHQKGVRHCCLSSDDRFIVSASSDRTLKIWDISDIGENTI